MDKELTPETCCQSFPFGDRALIQGSPTNINQFKISNLPIPLQLSWVYVATVFYHPLSASTLSWTSRLHSSAFGCSPSLQISQFWTQRLTDLDWVLDSFSEFTNQWCLLRLSVLVFSSGLLVQILGFGCSLDWNLIIQLLHAVLILKWTLWQMTSIPCLQMEVTRLGMKSNRLYLLWKPWFLQGWSSEQIASCCHLETYTNA